MLKQKDMERTMLLAHREFMTGLEKSIDMLESDINEATEMDEICTDEWCKSTELYIDELHKNLYSISEPRWADPEDSRKIHELRDRIKKLYAHYKGAKA